MRLQFLAQLHAHVICCVMQLGQYGCLSTRLDFGNSVIHVLTNESLQVYDFPFGTKFPLYNF